MILGFLIGLLVGIFTTLVWYACTHPVSTRRARRKSAKLRRRDFWEEQRLLELHKLAVGWSARRRASSIRQAKDHSVN